MTIQQLIEEQERLFWDELGKANDDCVGDEEEMLKGFRDFLRSSLQNLRDEMLDEVRKMKPDERKVATFGDWQAETYGEKMLVRAVLDTIIDKWK